MNKLTKNKKLKKLIMNQNLKFQLMEIQKNKIFKKLLNQSHHQASLSLTTQMNHKPLRMMALMITLKSQAILPSKQLVEV